MVNLDFAWLRLVLFVCNVANCVCDGLTMSVQRLLIVEEVSLGGDLNYHGEELQRCKVLGDLGPCLVLRGGCFTPGG